jgi:tripartite-type tricarboxylate transporter receptor subunit TctC
VAFDQPTQRFAALVGRQVDALLSQPGDVRGFVEAGEFRPILTIAEEHPDALAHDVPTHYEVGADFPPLLRWRGFFTHPDVPEERRNYLAQACEIAFQDERYQAFNEQNYMHLVDSFRGPEAFAEMIRQDIEVYREALE